MTTSESSASAGSLKYKKENNTKILRTTPEFKKRFKLKRAEDTNI